MGAVRGCREIPALQGEFAVPRFLWDLARGWLPVKHDLAKQGSFFRKQKDMMKDFDLRHPDHHRPLVIGKRPAFPHKPLAVMEAKGSKLALAPAPANNPSNCNRHRQQPQTSSHRYLRPHHYLRPHQHLVPHISNLPLPPAGHPLSRLVQVWGRISEGACQPVKGTNIHRR
jgi:hypothetical protein